MNSSLSLQALRYGHRQPLFAPLTLACRPGEIWAVLGANGRGKKYPAGYPDRRAAAAGREMQCEGGVALVPQSFRPAFRWRVSDVVLMGRARHVDLFAQPTRRMPGGLSRRWRSWGLPPWPKMTSVPSPAASSSWC
ncbi:iron complex transport system ATP-binding protein [Klebsiella pneumoniae MGH 31]|nr:iron complex transport system ATP-binding protein [Klebsiella pneumoniae MGH 31]